MTALEPDVARASGLPVADVVAGALAPADALLDRAGKPALAGGLALYAAAAIFAIDRIAWFAPESMLRGVALIGIAAMVLRLAGKNPYGGAVAAGAAIVFLGTGTYTIAAGLSFVPIGWRLLLLVADGALAVGLLGFLSAAARDRRLLADPRGWEIGVAMAGGLSVLGTVVMNLNWITERYGVMTLPKWWALIALVVVCLLLKSPTGVLAGGAAAAAQGLALLSSNAFGFSATRHLTTVGLVTLAFLGTWQLAMGIHSRPVAPPDRNRERSTTGATGASGLVAGLPFGSPVHASQAAPLDPAGFGSRLGAAIIDGIIFSIPQMLGYAFLIGAVAANSAGLLILAAFAPLVVVIALIVAYCRRTSRTGQSWGHAAVGIYLVDATTGRTVSAGRVFGRSLARAISAAPCYLGYFWMLWDPKRQTWHDKIATTSVVRSRPHLAQTGMPSTEPAHGAAMSPTGDLLASPPSGWDSPSAPLPSPVAQSSGGIGALGASAGLDELDDRTVSRAALADVVGQPARPTSGAVLVCGDGRRVPVASTVLIGRDPAPRADEAACSLLVLADPSVSKTHLTVRMDGLGRVWAEDRRSTNGVTVIRRELEITLAPGTPYPLEPADRLVLGDTVLTLEA